MISVCFQGKPFNITVIQVYTLTTDAKEAEVDWFYEDLIGRLELTPTKDVLFIKEGWNAKVGSQEIPGVIGKFGLGVQNDTGQHNDQRINPRRRYNNYKYICTQHGSTAVCKTNANKYERRL